MTSTCCSFFFVFFLYRKVPHHRCRCPQRCPALHNQTPGQLNLVPLTSPSHNLCSTLSALPLPPHHPTILSITSFSIPHHPLHSMNSLESLRTLHLVIFNSIQHQLAHPPKIQHLYHTNLIHKHSSFHRPWHQHLHHHQYLHH